MSVIGAAPSGFLGVTSNGADRSPGAADVCARIGVQAPEVVVSKGVQTATWGVPQHAVEGDEALLLCASARRHESRLSAHDVHRLLTEPESAALAEVLPTFAAVSWRDPRTLVVAADALGFRHLYRACDDTTAAVSTSAAAAASAVGAALDNDAWAVQSQLSWQLGQRTAFAGVSKVEPGTLVRLSGGRVESTQYAPEPIEAALPLDSAVHDAAKLLRDYLDAYLDDHPDAILQLTGGLDSRILLSAIRPARRRGLRVVTLGVPGVPDLDIAAELARRYGMVHEIMTLDGLEQLPAEEAYQLCTEASTRLDHSADPLAYASVAVAESRAEPGPRLSGLGGEVARGFYYFGIDADAPVTRARSKRLAGWRMFANDSVAPEALDPAFSAWAVDFATDEVHRVLGAMHKPWFAACDELYLTHRMQRWGGITEAAVCMQRAITNPMLDDRFISIATRLAPRDKRNARFLGRLQVELDDELARIPLENRPAPIAFANASPASTARRVRSNAGKLGRKALQRLRHESRPPAGGAVLAAKVLEHWRANPALLEPLSGLGIVDRNWLDAMLVADDVVSTSTVAFLLNLLGAQSIVGARPGLRVARYAQRA